MWLTPETCGVNLQNNTRLGCIYCLTQSGGYIYNLLHREQLHVSALVNGHLQVVYENTFREQLYKTYIWATYMGLGAGKVGTRSRIWSEGWMVWVTWRVQAVTKLRLSLL